MMKTTISRLLAAMIIVLLITCGTWGFRKSAESQTCALPWWNINDFPGDLRKWKGKEVDMDPAIFNRTGAELAANHSYHDNMGGSLSLHLALYTKPGGSLDHLPPVCYKTNGWLEKGVVPMSLKDADGKNFDIHVSRWEKDRESTLVAYWYQLGEHIILDRPGLGLARWKLRGRKTWPPLIKVLITSTLTDPEQSPEHVKEFAQRIYTSINAPPDEPDPASPAN